MHSHCLAPPLACPEGGSPHVLPAWPITRSRPCQVTRVGRLNRPLSSGCMAATRRPNKPCEPAAASVYIFCELRDRSRRSRGQTRSSGDTYAWTPQSNPDPGLKWTGSDAGSVPEILENISSAFLFAQECTCPSSLPSFTLCLPFSQMFPKIV